MKRSLIFLSIAALIALATFASLRPTFAQTPQDGVSYRHLCASSVPGFAHCNAVQLLVRSNGIAPAANSPSGLNPTDLQAAYNLPSSSAGKGQTVAIVDAQDDPNAEADLSAYRKQFGLADCTTANGCFKKVDQNGGTTYPTADPGWAEEISLDLDMVSAVCPNCHILLVEANSASFQDLGAAVNQAVKLGANTISNSYGGAEDNTEASAAQFYNHQGVVITASSGDNGFGVEAPAAFSTVVAVGGTTLTKGGGTRGWTEAAWNGAGSGCSANIDKPSWQKDTGCAKRSVADVAAVADPKSGVSVYDTYGNAGGWVVVGGTSASSPIIASVYALAGNANSINAASSLYSNASSLNDITTGSNGNCGNYLCNAGQGYDGPTGMGTPNGVQAF